MLKKYGYIDILFCVLVLSFIGISLYEFVRFILPHYSFFRAFLVMIGLTGLYYGYKKEFQITRMSHDIDRAKTRNTRLGKIHSFLMKHHTYIAYMSFILMSLIIIISMFLNSGALIGYGLLLFFIVYFVVKQYGFRMEYRSIKANISDMNTLRLFLLSFAVFFIVFKLICDSFSIPGDERFLVYIIPSGIYLFAGFLIFFESKSFFKKLFRPYNILMGGLIFVLVGLLVFQNNLIEMIGESRKAPEPEREIIVEDFNLPGIVSDEVAIEDDISYTKQLVSSIYDIETGLAEGSVGESVSSLQAVLGNLQYFIGEVSGNFDEETRLALTDALISECEWPDSTRGIFGPQAKECIDNLEILVPDSGI